MSNYPYICLSILRMEKNFFIKRGSDGGIGRHAGLKIPWAEMSVRVRFPFRVLERLAARRKTDLQPFLFPEYLPHPNTWGIRMNFAPKLFRTTNQHLSDLTHNKADSLL